MENYLVSHFGLLEGGDYADSTVKKPIAVYFKEIYGGNNGKTEDSTKHKKSYRLLLNLLFRKLF